MHRHGYKGRKLHRNDAQRKALLRGLAISLIEHHSIETTHQKAKELVPFIETTITKAKQGDLAGRRGVISKLGNLNASNELFDNLAPQMTARNSGHVRIKRSRLRVGDNAQLSTVSFVDKLKATEQEQSVEPATAEKVEATS